MKVVFLFVFITMGLSSVYGGLVPCQKVLKNKEMPCAKVKNFNSENFIDSLRIESDFEKMCCKSLCGDKNNQYNVEDQGFYIQRDDGSHQYKLRLYHNKYDDCKIMNMKFLPDNVISKGEDQSKPNGEYLQRIDEDTFSKLYY